MNNYDKSELKKFIKEMRKALNGKKFNEELGILVKNSGIDAPIELGKTFETFVSDKLKDILPKEAVVLTDVYYDTDEYINAALGNKTLQMDILVIYRAVFNIECKYLSPDLYSRIENCKTETKEYKGKVNLIRKDGTRIQGAKYGLRQGESHTRFLFGKLKDRFGKISVFSMTVYGGIEKEQMEVCHRYEYNYVKHIDEFFDFFLKATGWNFTNIDEEQVWKYLDEIECKDADREVKHIRQVEYFEEK